MKKEYTIYDLLVFVMGCTVCFILISFAVSIFVFKVPTTQENMGIRMAIADLMKVIAGGVLTIIGQKIAGAFKA